MTGLVHSAGEQPIELIVPQEHAGRRLDSMLADCFPQFSRTRIRQAIESGAVTLDGRTTKPAQRVAASQRVSIVLPPPTDEGPRPEAIPLEILYEDDWLIVVNKPAGMVVHPARGHWDGTLASALAFHFRQLSQVGGPARPGIVHRLDRDTSGLVLVAKHDRAHLHLANQFERRTVEKHYLAIVAPPPDRDRDRIDAPIGVHPYQREKMAIRARHHTTRDAQTFYEVLERLDGFAVLDVQPKTGRTHQIRVHLAHIGSPVLCDRLYGGRSQITRGEIRGDDDPTVLLARHALHARQIAVDHPNTGERVRFEAPLPEDMGRTLEEIRRYRSR